VSGLAAARLEPGGGSTASGPPSPACPPSRSSTCRPQPMVQSHVTVWCRSTVVSGSWSPTYRRVSTQTFRRRRLAPRRIVSV